MRKSQKQETIQEVGTPRSWLMAMKIEKKDGNEDQEVNVWTDVNTYQEVEENDATDDQQVVDDYNDLAVEDKEVEDDINEDQEVEDTEDQHIEDIENNFLGNKFAQKQILLNCIP